MDGDRTVAPGPGRLQRAWRAGMRPSSRWLGPGLAAIAMAAIIDAHHASPGSIGAQLRAALAVPTGEHAPLLWGLAFGALKWAGLGAVLVLGLGLAAALVTGALGPVDATERRTLAVGRLRGSGLPLVAIAAVALVAIGAQLVPVIAGSSRGVDASAEGLTRLWYGWCVRSLWMAGAVLVCAGLVELWLARRQQIVALHQSVEQAREDLRRRGGRRA